MSRDAASRYEIPGQLQQLLLDFTVSCLVERPADLVDFAADYFAQLRQRRTEQQQQHQQTAVQQTGGGGGLVAGSAAHGNGHGPESDDSMLTDESDEPSPGKNQSTNQTLILQYLFDLFDLCRRELFHLFNSAIAKFVLCHCVTADRVHVFKTL